MLESLYIILSTFAFLCLIISFFAPKRAIRFYLQAIALILFGVNAASSTNIEKFYCENAITLTNSTNITYSGSNNTETTYNNNIICEKNQTFDVFAVWTYIGFAMMTGAIAAITLLNMMIMKEEKF